MNTKRKEFFPEFLAQPAENSRARRMQGRGKDNSLYLYVHLGFIVKTSRR